MFGNRGPHNAILIFAIQGSMLGSIVVGLPVVPTEDVKDKIDEPEQIVYAVRCRAGTREGVFLTDLCHINAEPNPVRIMKNNLFLYLNYVLNDLTIKLSYNLFAS
ncbi:hypothetical protein FOC1_g10003819 [Fusarium oxysporum f. sp. cubense race 1]|uniref:Uncharacterized protein n=1 Tax=Fusarium oxysporum f. sp. cubense (strain race 1) TaxID=1229664 RepID=N4V3S3_FUSC1|nr:hypothetical protein FOC1_g10003819 [Fusarium oxysporum f. sp. cubense race 1]